jgi:hypothetical protein
MLISLIFLGVPSDRITRGFYSKIPNIISCLFIRATYLAYLNRLDSLSLHPESIRRIYKSESSWLHENAVYDYEAVHLNEDCSRG